MSDEERVELLRGLGAKAAAVMDGITERSAGAVDAFCEGVVVARDELVPVFGADFTLGLLVMIVVQAVGESRV